MVIPDHVEPPPTDIAGDCPPGQIPENAHLSPLPVCVDLDGTLVSSDLLLESLLQLIRSKPWCLFLLPLWMLGGRAAFKAAVAARTQLQPGSLPYNKALMAWLEQQRRCGRSLWLCTAANESVAIAIAEHLGIFQDVLASSRRLNLSGKNKAAQLEQQFGYRGFDYCGNERVDLHVWRRARGAIVVGDRGALEKKAAKCSLVLQRFPPTVSLPFALWRALKAHRWLKNLLVLVPLLVVDVPDRTPALVTALLAAIAFCLCASSAYVVNDLLDLEADRASRTKALRPFAAGDLSILVGAAMAMSLLLSSLTIAWFLPINAVLGLMAYFTLAVVCAWLSQTGIILQELARSTLNTLRLIVGTTAIGAQMPVSIAALCIALFLSFALIKRYATTTSTQRDPT